MRLESGHRSPREGGSGLGTRLLGGGPWQGGAVSAVPSWGTDGPPLIPRPVPSVPHCPCLRAPVGQRSGSTDTHSSLETDDRQVDGTEQMAGTSPHGRRGREGSPCQAGWQGRDFRHKGKPALCPSGDQASRAKIREGADLVQLRNRGQRGHSTTRKAGVGRRGGREAELRGGEQALGQGRAVTLRHPLTTGLCTFNINVHRHLGGAGS